MSALSTAPNFRDMGGLATVDGRRLAMGLLFRSEALLDPSDADAAALRESAIVLVCDLRSDSERDHAPNNWWGALGVERVAMDILGRIEDANGPWAILRDRPDAEGAFAAMESLYAAMPTAAAPHVAEILTRLASGDTPMLIHCTAGKDRTGFIAAMVQSALGVDHAGIMQDYLASQGRRTAQATEATRRMVRLRAGRDLPPTAVEAMMGVEARYLEASFSVIDRRFGGIAGYLDAAGVSPELLDTARRRVLV